jgi:hypothetical protein
VFWIGGSREEHAEADFQDKVMHLVALPWKLLFIALPPTDYFGGWLTFWVALAFIGLLTAFVSDLAELFGCCVGIPDIITALTFVALGTSMPDLFASLSAAREDPNADASIVNVTGSNSVNVFLGLGLPWTIGSVYWSIVDRTPDWEARYLYNPLYKTNFEGAAFMVESGNIVFTVFIFSSACIATLTVLWLRRVLLGGELGGPYFAKVTTTATLTFFWVGFVGVASWRSLRWQVSTKQMFMLVVGGTGFLEFCALAFCVWVIFKNRGMLQTQDATPAELNAEHACSSGGILPKGVRQGAGRRSLSKESEHLPMVNSSEGRSPRTLGQILKGTGSPKSLASKTKSPRAAAPEVDTVFESQTYILPQLATQSIQMPDDKDAKPVQMSIASAVDVRESFRSEMSSI